MIVVIADHIPPAVRGRMKLWFIEPKPNVFVSGIKDATAEKVIEYLYEFCPPSSNLLVFQQTKDKPGYKIKGSGSTVSRITGISGLQLMLENKIVSDK